MDSTKANCPEELSAEEKAQRRYNVAIKTKEQLKDFLEQSGRSWVVLNSADLVEALSFPEDVQEFMRIVDLYGRYRCSSPSGRTESFGCYEIPVMKTDALEIEELDRVIRFLVGKITEKKSDWSLDDPPL